jgi:hypothetical protein
MESVYCSVRNGSLNKTDYVSFWKGLKPARLSLLSFLIYTLCSDKTRGFRHVCFLLLIFFDSMRYSIVSHECCFVSHCRITQWCIKGGYTLVTLPRIVTPYRDSVDGTRDRVTCQKLVAR